MGKQISDLISSKDEKTAQSAAKELIETKNFEEYKKLCDKMDFLFDFVRENVYRRLENAITMENYKNIFQFFKYYSPYYDDFFASILAKYADEDLTDIILEKFEQGNNDEKAYCASYFKRISDTVAKEDLINNLSTDFEPLFLNCAYALGKMQDKTSFDLYVNNLYDNDDFTKLKAVKFLVSYGDITILDKLIETMQTSNMSENIAGEIVNLISPFELLNMDFEKGALLLNQLINGLGEILPLENLSYYDIPDVTQFLIENKNLPYSIILLFNLKNKIISFTQNDEYTFDLDKNTKNELTNLKKILMNLNLNDKEKSMLKQFINEDNQFLYTVLDIIRENHLKDFSQEIINLTKSKNETIICEAIYTLKKLGELSQINKNDLQIKNPNLLAIAQSHFAQ